MLYHDFKLSTKNTTENMLSELTDDASIMTHKLQLIPWSVPIRVFRPSANMTNGFVS